MPSTQFRTTLQPDAALVQSAPYRMNAADRQNLDQQVVDLQTLLSLALLNGVAATYALIDTGSDDIAKGDVLCRAQTSSMALTLADEDAIAEAGSVFGVALAAASAGARCLVAFAGAVSPDVTGLATSAAGAVRVSSAGRCERVGALLPGDYALGDVDGFGWLTMNLAPGVVGGLGSVTFEDVKAALAVADAPIDVNGQRITGIDTPEDTFDATNKSYVDQRYLAGDGLDLAEDGAFSVLYGTVGFIANVAAGNTALEGDADRAARIDHRHAVSTAAPVALAIGDAQSAGAATSLARSDHVHAVPAPAAPANVTKATASAGAATTFARSDHKHDVTTAAPSTIGTSNTEGSASSLARSDHVHAHGSQTVDTQHALAVAGVSHGFMDKADKTKIDGLSATAGNWSFVHGASTTSVSALRYLPPGYLGATAPSNEIKWTVDRGFTATGIRYRARVGGSGAPTITVTLLKNGSNSGLSVTVASTATTGSDTGTVTFAPGDDVSIQIEPSGALDSAPSDIMITIGVSS